ncbi:MAG: ABC transporter permease [Nitrospiraceae bacterium]|uniref:ABC transporter permease n=1 Tax=Nitrospira cf. moscoviensis SBR1015 TaxID=96242 RepID=UPI000A0B8CEE|nr:ABC transporter permease [Nitrospira cf. moscoviensis SBR1015]MBY0248835.1 ABC transporter permease [Nitrospiraceae bacterium]OQW31274.1 MAG: multidrug ABC transporter substrate-binding protein [Nitrospira sp. SG-bin2]
MLNFVRQSACNALRTFQRNWLRSGLAVLGIVIGVGSVIAMVSIGQGAKAALQSQIATIGTNVIFVFPGATTVSGVRTGLGGSATLTVADGIELRKRVPLLHDVGWVKREMLQVVNGNRNWNVRVYGVSTNYMEIREWPLASGGSFVDADLDSADRVALLGRTVVENLFEEGEEPVGSIIRIKNVPFRVIGVLVPKGQSAEGVDQDDAIFVPFTTAERKLFGTQFFGLVGAILASAEREQDVRLSVEEIRQVLRQRHRLQADQLDNFTIRTQVDIGQIQEESSHTLTVMLFAVAAISLLVGGIGIMNILLVSITERTKEIGVRMAVGARRSHILWEFLIEAVILSFVGGVLGVALGIVIVQAVTVTAGWPTIISAQVVSIVIAFSASIGLFFGLYPANKAARLNPIDALRYE